MTPSAFAAGPRAARRFAAGKFANGAGLRVRRRYYPMLRDDGTEAAWGELEVWSEIDGARSAATGPARGPWAGTRPSGIAAVGALAT
jgi:hypothetical protein